MTLCELQDIAEHKQSLGTRLVLKASVAIFSAMGVRVHKKNYSLLNT